MTTSKNRLVRYIMYNIENHISDSGKINFDDDNGTIEHILPENPNEDWSKRFVKDTQLEFIYRLGNYTILEKKLNKDCENKLINEKIPFYHKSKYNMSKNFEYVEWNPNKLKHRQSKLAKIAKQIWKLDY